MQNWIKLHRIQLAVDGIVIREWDELITWFVF